MEGCLNCNPNDKDYVLNNGKGKKFEECFDLCKNRKGCSFYTWISTTGQCNLHGSMSVVQKSPLAGAFAGKVNCSQRGKTLHYFLSNFAAFPFYGFDKLSNQFSFSMTRPQAKSGGISGAR